MARTRTALQQALARLMAAKPHQDITVDDICTAANVGRSTFYAHFRNKDDLRRAAIDDHLNHLLAERRKAEHEATPTLIVLEHVRDYWRQHRRHQPHSPAVAAEILRHPVTELLRKEIGPGAGESLFEREFRLRYLAGAFMAVLSWWVERGAREAPEQVEDLFRALSVSGRMECR